MYYLLLLGILFMLSGCVNLSNQPQVEPINNTTEEQTYYSSGNAVSITYEGKNSYMVNLGQKIPIPMRINNHLPINLTNDSVYLFVDNVLCSRALKSEKGVTNTATSGSTTYYMNKFTFKKDISKAVYVGLKEKNTVPYYVMFQIDTSYLQTPELTIPIYLVGVIGGIEEYEVCTRVAKHKDSPMGNCNVGDVSKKFSLPSDVNTNVKIESIYNDYKIIIKFNKNNNVIPIKDGNDLKDALVVKVLLNGQDITKCCNVTISDGTHDDKNNTYTIKSYTYIKDSGPFNEALECSLTANNTKLQCNDNDIEGTDIVLGKKAKLDIIYAYPFRYKIAEPTISLIMNDKSFEQCEDDTNGTAGNVSEVYSLYDLDVLSSGFENKAKDVIKSLKSWLYP